MLAIYIYIYILTPTINVLRKCVLEKNFIKYYMDDVGRDRNSQTACGGLGTCFHVIFQLIPRPTVTVTKYIHHCIPTVVI